VHVRSRRDAHVATDAVWQKRTCTCVSISRSASRHGMGLIKIREPTFRPLSLNRDAFSGNVS
jgi:hypothetical protein